jgi:hypothetical protein
MPKKSDAVVTTQLNGKKVEYVEKLLHVESGGGEAAAAILLLALKSQSMKGVRDLLQSKLEMSTDSQIVDSIPPFLTHHSTKGRCPKETENGVDAVQVAATVGSISESGEALRLGINTPHISRHIAWGKEMESKEISFVPSQTKQRSDCYG